MYMFNSPKMGKTKPHKGGSEHRQTGIQKFLDEVLQSERRLPPDVRAGFHRASHLMLDFVRSRGRVVYGGQAIDAALLQVGLPGIYAPDHLPDVDIYSPDPIGDMIDASNVLADNGFRYVMGIGRLHPTTRSVKYDFMAESVLDITHMPEPIYDALPKFEYEGILYTSIEFQACDLYAALARNPVDNFESRWQKDCDRLALVHPLLPAAVEETDLDSLADSDWSGHLSGMGNLGNTWFFMCPGVVFSSDPDRHIHDFLTIDVGTDYEYISQVRFSRLLQDQIPMHTALIDSSSRVDVFHHSRELGHTPAEYLVYEYELSPATGKHPPTILRVATPFLQHWFLDRLHTLRDVLPADFVGQFTPVITNATRYQGKPISRRLVTATSQLPDPGDARMGPAWAQVCKVYRPQKKRLEPDSFGDSTIEAISGERLP